jgi:ketosteroid isomerase-like protein
VLRPNVPPVRGTAAIREFFFGVLDAGLGEVDMEPLRVETFGDVAYEAGRCKMLVPFTMGKRREERGKYLLTLARQAGDWKILADCWSSDLSLGVNVDSAPPKSNVQTPNPAFKPPRKGP